MNFLCIGAGSIGKRHLKNLILLGIEKDKISVVDPRKDRLSEVKKLGINNTYTDLTETLNSKNFNLSIICSPTSLHIIQGIEIAKKGIHILMEKPLDSNLDNLKEFNKVVNENKLIVMMAYIFRFSPLIKKVKNLLNDNVIGKVYFARGEFSEYLPDWHPYEDYRSFYMSEKKLGGGSILDQSHIMDLVHFLLGDFERVCSFNGNLSNLELNSDDYAELLVKLKSGVVVSLHTDIFGREHKKQLEIKGEYGNIFWDHYENSVRLYTAKNKNFEVFNNFPTDFNVNYLDEIKHFINCCQRNETCLSPLKDGIQTMKLIQAAQKANELGVYQIV